MLPELLPELARLEGVHMNAVLAKEATVDILCKRVDISVSNGIGLSVFQTQG